MKVVGGQHDGLNVMVGAHRDAVRLLDAIQADEAVSGGYRYSVYTKRQVGGVEFLAPQDWSDLQALNFQFGK